MIRWDERSGLAVGETVVLPFSNGRLASDAIAALKVDEPFTWDFVGHHMTIALYEVTSIQATHYGCRFQKRIIGPHYTQLESDPLLPLQSIDVFLDYTYGLVLTQRAIDNCSVWLGFQVQRRQTQQLQSPIRELRHVLQTNTPRPSRSLKRSVEEGEEADEGELSLATSNRMVDMAGNSLYVSKHQKILPDVNATIPLRTMVPLAVRQELFPEAFSFGHHEETALAYVDPELVLHGAERRLRRGNLFVGGGDPIQSRGKCIWGASTNKDLRKWVVGFMPRRFDDPVDAKLRLEHFSETRPVREINTLGECVSCLRNLLLTYTELWGCELKYMCESTYVGYLEGFQQNNGYPLDWAYVARIIMSFYHNILEMMQHPLQEYRFPGIEVPVVPKDSLRSPSEWVGFMSRSFVPFCTFYFSKDQLWKWQTWKLEMGQQGAIYGVDNKNVHFPEAVVVPHVPSVPVVPQGVPKGGAKAANSPKQSFCLVDAFTALGIVDKLPKNITSKCRGE
jgi:hypothetical protein